MAGLIPTVKMECLQCGEGFTRPHTRGWQNYRYCGGECAQKAKKGGIRQPRLRAFSKRAVKLAVHGLKTCRVCGADKPMPQFHKSSNYTDGRHNRCAVCVNALHAKTVKTSETPERRAARLARKRAVAAAWGKANPDKILGYRAKHAVKHAERTRRWALANPDRIHATMRAHQARRRSVQKAGMSGPEMGEWWAKQKKICHWCGRRCPKDAQADHIMPLARGGEHIAKNLCVACPSCNRRKNAKDPIDWAQSLGKLL